jgi:hypothetical protein
LDSSGQEPPLLLRAVKIFSSKFPEDKVLISPCVQQLHATAHHFMRSICSPPANFPSVLSPIVSPFPVPRSAQHDVRACSPLLFPLAFALGHCHTKPTQQGDTLFGAISGDLVQGSGRRPLPGGGGGARLRAGVHPSRRSRYVVALQHRLPGLLLLPCVSRSAPVRIYRWG